MGLNFDCDGSGRPLVELDAWTERAVLDAFYQLAPLYAESDDPGLVIEKVKDCVRPIEGFEEGEAELIERYVESYLEVA